MKMIRVFLLGLVVAFGAVAEQKLPNILWITSEDNGPQLGCYGDKFQIAQSGCVGGERDDLSELLVHRAGVCAGTDYLD